MTARRVFQFHNILLFCLFFLFHLISFDMFNTDCKKSLKQTFNTAVDYNNVLTKKSLNNMIIIIKKIQNPSYKNNITWCKNVIILINRTSGSTYEHLPHKY